MHAHHLCEELSCFRLHHGRLQRPGSCASLPDQSVWGANANFQAAVPLLGKYTVTFEDAAGNPSWPGYASMGITGRLPSCANHITESDVTLVMPDTIAAGQCSSMTVNGDFNDGRRGWDHSWFPFRVKSEELATGELNYFLETTKRKLLRSNIYTWVDFSCVKPGHTYRFTGKFRLKGREEFFGCTRGGQSGCPSLSLRLTGKASNQNSPLKSFGVGVIDVVGGGVWTEYDFTITLPDEEFPEGTFQALALFRGPKKRDFLVDDFRIEHVTQ